VSVLGYVMTGVWAVFFVAWLDAMFFSGKR
jgi:hypothetical protein